MVVGTISELAFSLGYLWAVPHDREVPFWPLELTQTLSFRYFSDFLFEYKVINNILVGILSGMLFLSIGDAFFVLPSVLLMAFLFCCDLWRLYYHNYWLLGMTSLLFSNNIVSIQI